MRRLLSAGLAALCLTGTTLAGDWYIGAADPNELAVIDTDTYVDGDIYLVNHGRLLVVNDAVLTVAGNVVLLDDAALGIQQAGLRFPQPYSYASAVMALGRATVYLADAVVDSNYQSCTFVLAESAQAYFERVVVDPGFITWGLHDTASATLTDCTNAGEFLQMGANQLLISGCDSVLFWLTLPDGATVDVTLPPPGDVAGFSIDPTTPWASGIPYTFQMINCTNVNWASMARSGSRAIYRDSELLVSGVIFERDDQVEVAGLSNHVTLVDRQFQWGDVNLHFVNTRVGAWNYYVQGQTHLTLRSCVFGEIGVEQQGQAEVIESLCDGAGGHIFANDEGQIVLFRSTNLSQTLAGGQAVIVAANTALLDQRTIARDNGTLLLVNTATVGQPQALDAANIVRAEIEPVSATSGETVVIRGTAELLPGPQSGVEIVGYELDWGGGHEPTVWTPIAYGLHEVPPGGELGVWETCGRVPGVYTTRLRVLVGDEPIDAYAVNTIIEPPGGVCLGDLNCDGGVFLSDLSILLSGYAVDGSGDLDGDGDTDLTDLSLIMANWENICH